MKDITTTPTADLIAEWVKNKSDIETFELRCKNTDGFTNYAMREGFFVGYTDTKAKNEAIAAELDSRLQVMDIEHGGNYTEARNYMEDPYNDWVDGEATSKNLSEAEIKKIEMDNLRELRDLLTWLLLKEGGNNG